MKIHKSIPVIVILFLCMDVHAQLFGWIDDGYVSGSGGGTYTNIDNSGITLTVGGLFNDNSFNNNTVKTGVNNQAADGWVHTYNFSFSEVVDVSFRIGNINSDSTEGNCYNDVLVFDNTPLILNLFPIGEMIVSNDSVIPVSSLEGEIEVRYTNITSFSFTHGDGVFCNPGYLIISELVINDNILDVSNLNSLRELIHYNNIENEITVDCTNSSVANFDLFDAMGRKYNPSFTMNSGELKISTDDLNVGNYFIRVVLDDQEIFQSHFFKS